MGNSIAEGSASKAERLKEIAWVSLKLGTIGFGGIAGMVSTIENEMVVKRKWIDHQHFMDVLCTSYIIPGPNAVEIIMHCGKERGGRAGLLLAGVCYIAVGQITPGPILSSATFAGYLINGLPGGLLATIGIFLPAFFISFFLHKLVSSARRNQRLRVFLDGLSAASISIIAVVGLHLLMETVANWRGTLILAGCLALTLAFKKISSFYIISLGGIAGFLLLRL